MRITLKSRVRISVALMSMSGMLAAPATLYLWVTIFPEEIFLSSRPLMTIAAILGAISGAIVGEEPMPKFLSDGPVARKNLGRAAVGGAISALLAVGIPGAIIVALIGAVAIINQPHTALDAILASGFWTILVPAPIFGLPAVVFGCLGGMLVQIAWSKSLGPNAAHGPEMVNGDASRRRRL